MYVVVGVPSHEEERQIVEMDERRQFESSDLSSAVTTQKEILKAREAVSATHMNDRLKDYVVSLVTATRETRAI